MSVIVNGNTYLPSADGKIYGQYPAGDAPVSGDAAVLSLALSTAGRVSFYVDYSELATAGTHTFYVARTHGTTGAVSVNYATSGDTHTVVNGTLNWADGEANIKKFTVPVSSSDLTTHDASGLGEHRITATLSSPTGGLVLHNGTYTKAYGVVDNATMIASDANAVFYDSAAAGGGTGTQASPYNNIYTAITNLGAKRYLYGKGVTVPDQTNSTGAGGTATASCIFPPATRTSEATRVYIRNWPGSTWDIDGATETTNGAAGFYTESGESYQTYKGIDFKNLDGTVTGTINGHGILYRYGNSVGINVEHCTADNINGTANNGAYQLWGVDGGRVWRCTSNNIQTNGDNTNGNTGGVYTYLGTNLSVQRCEFTNSAQGVFHKRFALGDVSTAVRFCLFETSTQEAIHYSTSGSGDPSHEYTLAQNNIIKSSTIGISHNSGYNDASLGYKHAWSNNVFDSVAFGTIGAVHFNEAFSSQLYNNIFLDCRRIWNETSDSTGLKSPGVEYADYNLEFGTTLAGFFYGWKGTAYATAAALNTASGFAGNDTTGDPLFTNTASNDYSLQGGSPALTGGVSSTQQGIYLTGDEVIGA